MLAPKYEVVGLRDLNDHEDIIEDAPTLEECHRRLYGNAWLALFFRRYWIRD